MGLGFSWRGDGAAPADATDPTRVTLVLEPDGVTLTGTCSEVLDPASEPATTAFALTGVYGTHTVSTVDVTGSTFVVTLAAPAFSDDTITLAYTAPGSGKIRDLAGNNLASFGATTVTNNATAAGAYDPAAETGAVLDLSAIDSTIVLSSASLTNGSALDNAAWTKTNCTITANVAGTQDRIVTGAGAPTVTQNVTNPAAHPTAGLQVPLVHTVWASYESVQWLCVETRNGTAANQTFFDVQNGVTGAAGANTTSAIQAETRNGVAGYRCTVTTIGNGGTPILRLAPSTTNTTITAPAAATSTRIDDCTVSQVRVASITNRKTGVVWSQASADLQPAYEATGLSGAPCLRGYGAQYITSTEAGTLLANAAAYTLMIAASCAGIAAQQAFFGYGDAAQATSRTRAWAVNSTGKWWTQIRDNAGANAAVDSSGNADTSPHVHEWYGPGTTFGKRADGAAADPAEGTALNPGTLTPGRAGLFCRPASTVNLILAGKIGRVLLYSADVGAAPRARLRAKLGAQYST